MHGGGVSWVVGDGGLEWIRVPWVIRPRKGVRVPKRGGVGVPKRGGVRVPKRGA